MRAIWTSFAFLLSCPALEATQPLMVFSIPGQDPTNAVNYPVFGLQHALKSSYNLSEATKVTEHTKGNITLFPKACGDETQNCTAACLDSARMFGNLETLHNCGVYRTISEQWARGNLHVENISFVKDLGFKSSSENSSSPSDIFNAIQNCQLDTYHDTKDYTKNIQGNRGTENPYANNYSDICTGISAPVVADVGGIGVYTSYAMQMGLALLAFVFAIPWVPIIYAIYNTCRTCLGLPSKQYNSSIAKERSQKSLHEENIYPEALTTALVAFQKAQCFFMLGANIAGLVVLVKGGLQPQSFQQLYNTYIFIKVIAIGGFLPISFTLLTLHMIHKLSWYLLTLSVIAIGVAAATLFTRNSTFPPDAKDLGQIMDTASTGGPATCASKNLAAWCYNPKSDFYSSFGSPNTDDGAYVILAFCVFTTVILIIDHFCRSQDERQQNINKWTLKKLHITFEEPLSKRAKRAKRVLGIGIAVFRLIFFGIYLYCFYFFAILLQYFLDNQLYEPTWGFGQIVAILVWAPTLCDYLWEQARGVEKGFEHCLPNHLELRPKRKQEYSTGGEAGAAREEAAAQVHGQKGLV